jgi:hypothetical protein
MRGAEIGPRVRHVWRVARNLLRGELRYVLRRALSLRSQARLAWRLEALAAGGRTVGILTTPHTMFLAHQLALALTRLGWGAEIQLATVSPNWAFDLYIVICPQMFDELPPLERCIAFQMEQSVYSRWFTANYLDRLRRCQAVLDYSRVNIEYLQDHGIEFHRCFWVPVGGISGYRALVRNSERGASAVAAPIDVLFYGDASSPRRRRALAALREHWNVRVATEVFGAPLHELIERARVVVNIHYDERALLETTRIYECLSLGATVVSEVSDDLDDHPQLQGVVHFVELGDYADMALVIQRILSGTQQPTPLQDVQPAAFDAAVVESQERFHFMLYRALYALRLLSHEAFAQALASWTLRSTRIVLSLPETTARRRAIEKRNLPASYWMFDGLRYVPGWVGCGLSYAFLARKALERGESVLEVMEDDAVPVPDYGSRRRSIDHWLAANRDRWDVFAGLIASVHPDTCVLAVEPIDGSLLVTVDRMISAVHNIYASRAIEALAVWDPRQGEIANNTIDRYLQRVPGLRVVVAIPFLTLHAEDQESTLWAFPNAHYARRIAEAEQALLRLAERFGNGASQR